MTLKFTIWHPFLWASLLLFTSAVAIRSCLVYNSIAGTDILPFEIVVIGFSTALGPMVGPIANPEATQQHLFFWATVVLAMALGLSLLPFALIRKPVTVLTYTISWAAFTIVSVVWFGSAIVSLAYCLS